ncbi:malate dehydrogenase [Nannochloropsis gaditana]|uniref:Malate dehydrogenase n=1 Tax=Nannochloropsis gaditana TaxID=72520 RepID=W7TN59_9STRA|nr:malate dehydrogenase [Nannochloropsis gaditana]
MFAARSSLRPAAMGAVACAVRSISSTKATAARVAVVGASGGIGQPLSMLLKLDPSIKELNLYDIVHTPGVAADLSHIPFPAKVTGYKGADSIHAALEGCDVIVVPAGVPRKPGMTRDDLFNINAGIVKTIAEASAKVAPKACYLIISNPVNSTVPIFAEVLKKAGTYNPKKLFGVTTLDVIRANTFVAENQGTDVLQTNVTVVGGHAGTTILPLLSQVKGASFTPDALAALTHRIQFGGDEVVKAKDGAGSATLSMAYAGYLFTAKLLQALKGEKDVVACAFVENTLTAAPFFAAPVTLGKEGVEKVHALGSLSAMEQEALEKALPDLLAQAKKGVEFVQNAK